jgi:hypothetical protein
MLFFRRGEEVPMGMGLRCGKIENGVAWGSVVACSGSERSGSRSIALFETMANSPDTRTFCFDLCQSFRRRGGNPKIVSGLDFLPNYGSSFSDLAELAPVVVGRMLQHLALAHSHCVLLVSLSCSLAWARECVCIADTVLLLEHERDDDVQVGDQFAVLTAVPTASKHISREVVVIRQVFYLLPSLFRVVFQQLQKKKKKKE